MPLSVTLSFLSQYFFYLSIYLSFRLFCLVHNKYSFLSSRTSLILFTSPFCLTVFFSRFTLLPSLLSMPIFIDINHLFLFILLFFLPCPLSPSEYNSYSIHTSQTTNVQLYNKERTSRLL